MLYVLVQTLGARAFVEQSNEDAFQTFTRRFNRRYLSEEERQKAFGHFVHNYKNLLKLEDCDYCDMNHFMDRDFSEMLGGNELPVMTEPLTADLDCSKYLCVAANPLPMVSMLFGDIDLREAGTIVDPKSQGSCGSCYAFATGAIVQNAVLQDQANLKTKNPFWTFNSKNLSISEQFLMSNDFADGYCSGGSFSKMINVIYQNLSTIELTSNFPYDPNANKAKWEAKTAIAPKIATKNYLVPFQGFTNIYDRYGPKVATIQLFQSSNSSFDVATTQTVKSYLSRGLAVSVGMYVPTGSPFFYYSTSKGQVLYEACPEHGKSNHAVTIVGYGKKGGKYVWVVANSWGTTNWGDRGVFFVEQGKNAYCIENRAQAAIPKYMNITSTARGTKGSPIYRGLSYGLDPSSSVTGLAMLVGAGTAFVAIVFVIAVVIVATRRSKARSTKGYTIITNDVL